MSEYLTLNLQGDHYTMGRQHGLQVGELRPLIVEAIEAVFEQLEQSDPDAQFEALLRETRELLQEVDAPLLEMIRGQAEALELDFDMLLRYDLAHYLLADLRARRVLDNEGCSSWAATGSATADRQPILAKNRDQRLKHLPMQIVACATPESGYRYVYSGSAGSPGIFCAGINEAGLAVADTAVSSTDLGPGLPDYSLMMHILEEHDSVASAVDYLRSVPRMGRNNVILADAQGHLAVFEIGHRNYGLFETHDGVLENTNHFVSSGLWDCYVDVYPVELKGCSIHRRELLTRELNGALGQIDVPFAERLMATHAGPRASLCRHPRDGGATISTSIFLPVQRTMRFSHGLPCQGRYDDFTL